MLFPTPPQTGAGSLARKNFRFQALHEQVILGLSHRVREREPS